MADDAAVVTSVGQVPDDMVPVIRVGNILGLQILNERRRQFDFERRSCLSTRREAEWFSRDDRASAPLAARIAGSTE